MVRFTISLQSAGALDRFYRRQHLCHTRPIRRVPNSTTSTDQGMMASCFAFGVLTKAKLENESLDQTIFRLTGGVTPV